MQPAAEVRFESEPPSVILEPAPSAPSIVEAQVAPEPPATPAPAPPPEPPPDPEELARRAEQARREQLEREYPWHGIAYHFLAQVHARADGESPVLGYMRRGSHFRAQPGLRGRGCGGGWHRVAGGGYVCRGSGFALGDRPQSFEPSPVGAATDDALPYVYAWVARDDAPQYWRLPTRAEERIAQAWIERQREAEARAEIATPDEPSEAAPEEAAEAAPEEGLEAPPGLDVEGAAEQNAEPSGDAGVAAADEPEEDVAPAFLRMRMRRGFYVSVDRLETVEGRRFYRTIRGAYVPAAAMTENQPTTMRGVVLGGRWQLPVGFVYRGGVRELSRAPVGGALRLDGTVERMTPLPLSDETITRRRRRYRISGRGRIVREDAMRIARTIPRPPQAGEDERWIHVDLDEQILVAYEGDRPVFATMVSTGREGFETPTGTFRIQSKHVSTTMDDLDGGEEAYSIEDVPWTMYFEGSYALHAAFWHDRFGRVRSHGCVNLAPADARWLFSFAGPDLAPSFHGGSARRGARGTLVHITSASDDAEQ